MTKPHFLQTTSFIAVAILVEPHSGHFIFIKKLNFQNFLNFFLFQNIFLKNYTLPYELRNIYILFKYFGN
jgi:hypothetical protein